jgi:hypothetical protein
MLKTLANRMYKSQGSLVSKSVKPREQVKRNYASEVAAYAHAIRNGLIAGVDPREANTCPVCSGIFKELYGEESEAVEAAREAVLKESEDAAEDTARKIWMALWLLHHESTAEVHDFTAENFQ